MLSLKERIGGGSIIKSVSPAKEQATALVSIGPKTAAFIKTNSKAVVNRIYSTDKDAR